jgi:hypothetical protein
VVTDIVEVGLDFSLSHVDIEVDDADSDATAWRIGPYAEANFPVDAEGTVLLAPGIGVSYSSLEGDAFDLDGFDFTVAATLKCFVAENASVDSGLQFTYFTGDADTGGFGDVDADGFVIGPRIGISIWP